MSITREQFIDQHAPKHGTSNPQRMEELVWEWMIRGQVMRLKKPTKPIDDGLFLMEGVVRRPFSPWRAREQFGLSLTELRGPIWTFDRMGQSRTELPAGRFVYIGGEHEDYYDPDFCIYNDVVVLDLAGKVEIFGYPASVFPPTDFHTATLVDGRIIVIGGIGYQDARTPGFTPVYSLDLETFAISAVPTTGEMPGWIFKHDATLRDDGSIVIVGGEKCAGSAESHKIVRSFDDYSLDLRSGKWTKLTDRRWRIATIQPVENHWYTVAGKFVRESELLANLPGVVLNEPPIGEYQLQCKFTFNGISAWLENQVSSIEIVVQGEPVDLQFAELIEAIRTRAEALYGFACKRVE